MSAGVIFCGMLSSLLIRSAPKRHLHAQPTSPTIFSFCLPGPEFSSEARCPCVTFGWLRSPHAQRSTDTCPGSSVEPGPLFCLLLRLWRIARAQHTWADSAAGPAQATRSGVRDSHPHPSAPGVGRVRAPPETDRTWPSDLSSRALLPHPGSHPARTPRCSHDRRGPLGLWVW